MRPNVLIASTLLLCSVGCTVGPKYARPKLDVPGGYRAAAPELKSEQPNESLGDEKWFGVFQDEQLQALICTALRQNYNAQIAAERVIAAQAQLGITRSDQRPNLAIGAGVASTRTQLTSLSPVYQAETAQLGTAASWELDFWGKYRKSTEAARANLAATEWGRKAVISTLVSNVASSYFQLRALDLELEITLETLKSRQESLRLTQLLAENGATPMMDVRQAEQLVYAASAAIPDLERQIAQQENALSLLVGQNPGPIARGVSLVDQKRSPVVPAGVPSDLIARRPDIRAAEEQLIAANAQIGVAKAQYFPTISLTGNVGTQSTALSSLFSGPATLWNVGPTVTQPVYIGGRLKNNVRLAESQQRQALLDYRQTVQGAFRDVSDSLTSYQKSREVREHQEKLMEAAKDASRLAEIRYKGGSTAYLEVLTNNTNYYSAELSLAQARLGEMLSLVQLYGALGGGWQ
ncbi:MAG TPA: efflux transporter outer membrane subunit [Candidatus Saccharimonadales bacterium]|nr:efflux transporter outer membrane subunit [Candidatus Saccharimonadales bacterium]